MYEESCIIDFQDSVYDLIQRMRLFFKSHDFEYEKEYRIAILVRPDNDYVEEGGFTKGVLYIPYVSIKLDNNLPINSIKIGPIMNLDSKSNELRDSLISNRVENASDIPITKSSIHVRY